MALSVLMFCPQFRPMVGGAERQAEKLAKELVKRGLQITILTPKIVGDSPDFEEDTGVAIHRFPIIDICKRFPKVGGLGPLNLWSIGLQTRKAVSRLLKKAYIVHTHIASPMTAFAMQEAQRKGIPVLCKVAMAGERTDLGELSRIGLGGPRLVRAMIRGIERWVATTEAVRESLIAYGIASKKIVAIPNGVDLMGPKTVHREREVALRFLYLGRLSTNIQRDIPTLIKAFDRVADKLSKVELALVGDGDLFQETARLVELARNRARIRMPGLQEPAPWLSWADCLVLPSRREGLSNSLLEGMAHGLACIANDIPQNREVLDCGRAGVLVPVGDEDHLVNELLRMATEPGFAEAVGKSAMQQVGRKYSIEQVAGKYVKLYEELMKI